MPACQPQLPRQADPEQLFTIKKFSSWKNWDKAEKFRFVAKSDLRNILFSADAETSSSHLFRFLKPAGKFRSEPMNRDRF